MLIFAGEKDDHYSNKNNRTEEKDKQILLKKAFNRGETPQLSFWRDNKGNEVDLLESIGSEQFAYEIKSGKTYSADYARSLKYWAGLLAIGEQHPCNLRNLCDA